MSEKIIVYGTGCPQCKVIESLLKKAGLEYEKDTDINHIKEMGFKSMPVVRVGEKAMTYPEAYNYFRSMK